MRRPTRSNNGKPMLASRSCTQRVTEGCERPQCLCGLGDGARLGDFQEDDEVFVIHIHILFASMTMINTKLT